MTAQGNKVQMAINTASLASWNTERYLHKGRPTKIIWLVNQSGCHSLGTLGYFCTLCIVSMHVHAWPASLLHAASFFHSPQRCSERHPSEFCRCTLHDAQAGSQLQPGICRAGITSMLPCPSSRSSGQHTRPPPFIFKITL